MEYNICPYPGLRPYTEEESVYFKGRDEHVIDISKLIEQKKFLMVTGASGDGKSSLIFAGVMPYARAGLLKATFNNWVLADFRPERSPLANLSRALSGAIKVDRAKTDFELQLGFSALIDLYKESEYFEDFDSPEWIERDESDKKKRKRKCANLLILVDQFEEFFTNSENYSKGNPSDESQNVVNLLLETATLAQKQDIPIYIICTMRSDYIGQCASFQNLPEFIGHSHFFVPRLKRQEIRQVIEEPALLSGMEIKSGLVEILINSISEGFDQLPLLQHTLHQIWRMAAEDGKAMDLIHLAKVGGISPDILSKEDQVQYQQWFDGQPSYKKVYLRKSGLGNVLNLHANELYETALNVGNGELNELSKDEAKEILKRTFQCLTKVDDGRGVRNRLSVGEVLSIIDMPSLSLKVFTRIVNNYRTQGNTFISPFIFTEENNDLSNNTILDITHEALLRNWDKLINWTKEEDRTYQNFIDFRKQLARWKENDRSRGFLLPIGPLNHFQEWYQNSNLNQFWIKKYEGEGYDESKAVELLKDTTSYLRKSRLKNFFGLLLLKHGLEKVINITLLIFVVFVSVYFIIDYSNKKDSIVLNNIIDRTEKIYSSPFVKDESRMEYVILREIGEKGKGIELLSALPDTAAIETGFRIYQNLSYRFSHDQYVFLDDLYRFLEEKIKNNRKLVYLNTLIQVDQYLEINRYDFYDSSKKSQHIQLLVQEVNGQINSGKVTSPQSFVDALKIISWYRDQVNDYKKLVTEMSPFEDGKEFFATNFDKDKYVRTNEWGNAPQLSHNGGYHGLALLYAGMDEEKLLRSLDTLYKYSAKTINLSWGSVSWTDYIRFSIAFAPFPRLVFNKIANNISEDERRLFENFNATLLEQVESIVPYMNPNYFSSPALTTIGLADSPERLENVKQRVMITIKDIFQQPDEFHFYAASFMKRLGYKYEATGYPETASIMYDSAFAHFHKISDEFLDTKYKGPDNSLTGLNLITARTAFLIPNNTPPIWTTNSYQTSKIGVSGRSKIKHDFIDKILNLSTNKIDSGEYVKLLNGVLYTSLLWSGNPYTVLPDTNYIVENMGRINQLAKHFDIYLDTTTMHMALYALDHFGWEKLDTSVFRNSSYMNGDKQNEIVVKNSLLGLICTKRAVYGSVDQFIGMIENEKSKDKVKLEVLNNLIEHGEWLTAYKYTYDALNNMYKNDDYSLYLLRSIAAIGGDEMIALGKNLIKNIPDEKKAFGIKFFIEGLLMNNRVYDALDFISDQSSFETEIVLMNEILKQNLLKKSDVIHSIWFSVLKLKSWREARLMFQMDDTVFYF